MSIIWAGWINPIVTGDYFPSEHKKNYRIERRIIQSDPKYAALNDIEEKYNLSHLHPDIVETLKTELHAWLRDMNALIPAKNPDWQPWRDADLNPMD